MPKKNKVFVICYKYETHSEAVLTAKDSFDAINKLREVLPDVDITLVTEQTLEVGNASEGTESKSKKPNREA